MIGKYPISHTTKGLGTTSNMKIASNHITLLYHSASCFNGCHPAACLNTDSMNVHVQ